jgi:CelD/BcsL family acetyltransferase involved in cellulose biosynthesis
MKLITHAEGLVPLREPWLALEPHVPLPTQSHAWVRAAAMHLAPAGSLCVAVAGEPGLPLAMAPLRVRWRGPRRRLDGLSVAELSEPFDLLWNDRVALDELLRGLVRHGMPLCLDRLPADSPTIEAAHVAYGRRGVVFSKLRDPVPYIRLDDAWREPASKLKSRRRSDLRRAHRRAEAIGPTDVTVHAPGPHDVDDVLDAAWDVEARSWRARRHGALAQDPLRGPFFRTLARAAAEQGTLRVALLRAGEKAIAMQLAVVHGPAVFLLKVGFDEDHGKCSPGMLLTEATIRHAAEAGLERYEFLGVVERWTSVWTDDVHDNVSLRAYPPSLRGAARFLTDALGAARRRLGSLTGSPA